MSPTWRDLAAGKRRQQLESIPKDWIITVPREDILDVTGIPSTCWPLLSTRELEITETEDVDILLGKLAAAEWSAVEVTTAFCKRAVVAHQLVSQLLLCPLVQPTDYDMRWQVNCLTEIFIDRALARAAELDEHLRTTGVPVGPLHGLPVSLKDQFDLKGIETTIGLSI